MKYIKMHKNKSLQCYKPWFCFRYHNWEIKGKSLLISRGRNIQIWHKYEAGILQPSLLNIIEFYYTSPYTHTNTDPIQCNIYTFHV